jgi:hypothetical protein
MRRGIGAIALVVVILAGVGIGVSAYRAGERSGVAQGIQQVHVAQQNGQEVQLVHVVDEGRGVFFPGFFLFPFFLIGGIFLIRGIFLGGGRGGRGGPHGYGPGSWNEDGRRRFEARAREWHQHEHGDPSPSA